MRQDTVDVAIKKVGERDGQDRFILVNAGTRQVVSSNDVSEKSLRRFFRQLGADDHLIGQCIQRARDRYATKSDSAPRINDAADTMEDEDLLFELGLDDDEDVH
jgi:hypothetical protein